MDTVKTILSLDGNREIQIYRNRDGFYSYTAFRKHRNQYKPYPEAEYWTPQEEGGLFETADAAEADAKANYDWARE